MSGTTAASKGTVTIRPFTVDVPEAELEMLRARVEATRWPEKETVSDESQGVQSTTMNELASYWASDYNYFNEVDRGNHFAAWQEPQLFATEVRAGFQPLR